MAVCSDLLESTSEVSQTSKIPANEIYRRGEDNMDESELEQEILDPDLQDVPLTCFTDSTLTKLKINLDIQSDIQTENGLCKDYTGVAEWANLGPQFIRYIANVWHHNKISEVISMWLKEESDGPKATVGNFIRCLQELERPDVLSEVGQDIVRDARTWRQTEKEACTKHLPAKDTSWQLTRHDVVTGKKTYYKCCLIFADEDEGMASRIIKLFQHVYSNSRFFCPQFDLKQGKYVLNATTEVIEERCNRKVIFLISEYFYASTVCQFTVNFTKHIDVMSGNEQGNLIPFYLTHNYDYVPRLLRGIHGIKWYRKASRRNAWCLLTDALLGGTIKPEEVEKIKSDITKIVEDNPNTYLCDPPYEKDTPSPGMPISVYDPPPDADNSDDPSSRRFNPCENDSLVGVSPSCEDILSSIPPTPRTRSVKTRLLHYVRKKIINRVFRPA